jgi:hypothetical protein
VTPAAYRVGDQVEVRAFRRWRRGVVVAVGRRRVEVRYATQHGLVTHQNTFPPGLVRQRAPEPGDPAR